MKPAPAYAPRGSGTARPGFSRIITLVLVIFVAFFVARSLFGHRENKYEKIAGGVTAALQKNDVADVKKYQNAETATQVTASRVGRGADALGSLGTMKNVKETSADTTTRVHQFDVTFDKGTVRETIKFDPDDKIVSFRYDQPTLAK